MPSRDPIRDPFIVDRSECRSWATNVLLPTTGGEPTLKFDMAKLVDRACLPENPAAVSIREEVHQ
jgi:hypothetical protein